jgi:transcriptional regulator with XRE-family HTH domain
VTLGKEIRSLRDEIGMSQAQLAAGGGLSQGYLSQLENDDVQNPSAAVLSRLCRAMNVDLRVLMEAAGYEVAKQGNGTNEHFQVPIDLGLLGFIASLTLSAQMGLFECLSSFKPGGKRVSTASLLQQPGYKTEQVKLTPRTNRGNNLGGTIRYLREKLGVTQGQLADPGSLSQGYISQLENGEVKSPSAAVLFRLAGALRVKPDVLFEAAGYPTARLLRDNCLQLESRVLPELRDFLAELPRETQRRLLSHLEGIKDLIEPKEMTSPTQGRTTKHLTRA